MIKVGKLKENKRKYKISVDYKLFFRYIVYFAMFLLLALAKGRVGISPFYLGLYVALIYAKESIYILSAEYLLAINIINLNIDTLIISSISCLVFIIATIAHRAFKKPMKIFYMNIYALIANLPIILFNTASMQVILNAIAMIIVSQIFTYTTIIIAYAVIVRGVRYRFNKDEIFSFGVLLLALSIGLYNINIYGFLPFYIIVPLILLFVLYANRPLIALITAVVLGLGAGITSANILVMAGLVLSTLLASVFMSNNIYFSAVTFLLSDIFVGMYFKTFGAYSYQHLVMISTGILIFLVVPKSVKEYIVQTLGGGNCTVTERAIVNRNRRDVSEKLDNLGKVFYEISSVIAGGSIFNNAVNSKELSKQIASDFCAVCPNVDFCANMLGGDTSLAIYDLIEKALHKDKIDANDASPFLIGRCNRIDRLVEEVSSRSRNLKVYLKNREQIGAGRLILGEQLYSISKLLGEMSLDVRHNVFFDNESERKIIEELAMVNIVAREVIVSGESGTYGVTITIRRKDIGKKELLVVLENILKNKFYLVEKFASDIAGYDVLRLNIEPRYSIVYGIANQTMRGSMASGDTYSVECIGDDRVIIALCDGMGSGELARLNSSSTISMIENFYKAGFNNNSILSLINKILATYNGESFTCLDMVIVDLKKGAMDIIKLGGVQSLMLRQGILEEIGKGALPLGIVEEAKPFTDRKIILHDDMVVMYTDGILDALGIQGITEIILDNHAKNPQVLADNILERATLGGAKDDSTVIVFRIYAKKG